jgi:hypothetical protein
VFCVGDINNDTVNDLGIGASSYSTGSTTDSAMYVLFGKSTAFSSTVTISSMAVGDGIKIY